MHLLVMVLRGSALEAWSSGTRHNLRSAESYRGAGVGLEAAALLINFSGNLTSLQNENSSLVVMVHTLPLTLPPSKRNNETEYYKNPCTVERKLSNVKK